MTILKPYSYLDGWGCIISAVRRCALLLCYSKPWTWGAWAKLNILRLCSRCICRPEVPVRQLAAVRTTGPESEVCK